MGRPSVPSWDDPPFEPYAYLAPPDPTRHTGRRATAQKRPPFQKNDGTPGHRSGQTILRSWAVRRSKRMPLPSGAIRPVFPIVWLRPENDLRYLHVCPLFFRNSLEHTPPHIVGREPTPSLPYIFVGIVPRATPGDEMVTRYYMFAPSFSEIRSSRHLPILLVGSLHPPYYISE